MVDFRIRVNTPEFDIPTCKFKMANCFSSNMLITPNSIRELTDQPTTEAIRKLLAAMVEQMFTKIRYDFETEMSDKDFKKGVKRMRIALGELGGFFGNKGKKEDRK